MTSDLDLLGQYERQASEAAFAELVQRHVNLVYSAALRQVRSPQLAEEVAQSVFTDLARNAARLNNATGGTPVLTAWLYQVTRHTAIDMVRKESRRQVREQIAVEMTNMNATSNDWTQIEPLLDEAMDTLDEMDRAAILLRYFENKNLREVGQSLGTSDDAAQKRVSRAVERLREFFSKRNVTVGASGLAVVISTNAVQATPAVLAKSISTVALIKGAAAGGSTLILSKTILVTMKTKIVVATIVIAAVILGTGTWLVFHSRATHLASVHNDTFPIKFANNTFAADGNQDGRFLVGVDSDTRRTTNSAPAIHLKIPLSSAANGNNQKSNISSFIRYIITKDSPLLGQHIHVTGWLKTSDIQNWVGAFFIFRGKKDLHFPYDDMSDRPIRGTTDWQQIDLVTDVPNEPCVIYIGPALYGPGELWGDDFQIAIAPRDEPITDSRTWRRIGESYANYYAETTDYNNMHDGNATICLTYTSSGPAPRGSWTMWGQTIYIPDIDKYAGHTVRMTGWVKTENVSGRLKPSLQPYIDEYKLLAQDSMVNDYGLKGTCDWTQFSVICVIPKQTQYLRTGFALYGSGKVWIDMGSLKFEIVE